MIEGSTFTLSATSLPVTDFRAVFRASRFLSLSVSATVMSAVASPLNLATKSAESANHVSHREQPAIGGENFEKFRGNTGDTGFIEHRRQRL